MHDNPQRILPFLAPLLLCACSLVLPGLPGDSSGGDDTTDPPPQPAYTSHVIGYGNSFRNLDQDVLAGFDLIILEAEGLSDLAPRFREKAILYFDMWGKSCHTDSLRHWPEWQPAPGEIGQPKIVLNDEVYCYRFDDAHVQSFLGWIEDFLAEHGSDVRGVFLDDFAYDRDWWSGDPADKDVVWGPMDGRPGWREEPGTWNVERVEAIEDGASVLVAQYCGPDGLLVTNGNGKRLATTRRFAENVGNPNSETWDRLEVPGVDERRYIRRGDFLQVNGVGASGTWGDWTVTDAGHGLENLERAAALAIQRGCSVGLSYGESPREGGSQYQLFLPPVHSEGTWPDYFAEIEDQLPGSDF